MTVLAFPHRYATDMAEVARAARRNTHLIVAKHKRTGEARSWHARPRGEARECRDLQRQVLGDTWTVRAVRIRRLKISALFLRG